MNLTFKTQRLFLYVTVILLPVFLVVFWISGRDIVTSTVSSSKFVSEDVPLFNDLTTETAPKLENVLVFERNGNELIRIGIDGTVKKLKFPDGVYLNLGDTARSTSIGTEWPQPSLVAQAREDGVDGPSFSAYKVISSGETYEYEAYPEFTRVEFDSGTSQFAYSDFDEEILITEGDSVRTINFDTQYRGDRGYASFEGLSTDGRYGFIYSRSEGDARASVLSRVDFQADEIVHYSLPISESEYDTGQSSNASGNFEISPNGRFVATTQYTEVNDTVRYDGSVYITEIYDFNSDTTKVIEIEEYTKNTRDFAWNSNHSLVVLDDAGIQEYSLVENAFTRLEIQLAYFDDFILCADTDSLIIAHEDTELSEAGTFSAYDTTLRKIDFADGKVTELYTVESDIDINILGCQR